MIMKKFIPVFLVILVSCVPWNIAPNCKIEAPEKGSEYLRGDTIQVYINANDDDGEIAEVRLYLDGKGIFSMNIFPYIYPLETAKLEIGTHYLKAKAFDNSSKEAESEVSFLITSGLPIVRTLQPVLVSSNDLIVGGAIIDDGGGTISVAGIMWSNDPYDVIGNNELIAEVNNNTFTITLTDLEYNIYYVTAFVENESGRSFGEIAEFSIPAPPVCEILEPIEGSLYTQGDSINILVNATDVDGIIREVRIYVDEIPVAASSDFPYAFIYATAGLSVGLHTVQAEAEDDSGIHSDDTSNFLIKAAK
jgi:hypothetical protein